uniref:Uncharacterized protein n=1 Tax=viral metagenome TaxID=1070528 RepID=A0A6H2A4G8_9ZZZZ
MIKRIANMMDRITGQLKPYEYKYLGDIRIELLIKPTSYNTFMRSVQELEVCGRVQSCGNRIRLNQ